MKIIWIILLAVVATFGLTLAIAPTTTLDVWVVRKQAILLTGVTAFALMSLIMLLAVRPTWLEKPLDGLDRMYRAHKWAGILAIALALLHYLLELGGPLLAKFIVKPAKGPRVEAFFDAFRGSAKDLGEWSAWLLAAMLVITLWQRFPYHLWRYVHKTLAAVYLVLAFHGVVLAPAGYWTQPIGWLIALCAAVGSLCALWSLSGQIGRQRIHQGVVISIDRPGDRVLEATCKLQGRWQHRAGQFAFLTCNRLEGQHPFTISSSDRDNGEVRFSIKALGDYTQRLQDSLGVGDPIKVEGPYGCFNFHREKGERQVWIAGGIGITPFLAWLESLQEHPKDSPEVMLFYYVASPSDAIYASRLRELCEKLPFIDLCIHFSESDGYLQAADLGMQPDALGRWPSVWFCGPRVLAARLRSDLHRQGMPRRCFHLEAFQMR
nr:ferric reductase-like transmembrane domain-containing protein [Pseudomonas sp. FFPRI_1]